ncbi:MAG: arginine repressor [Clostridiales bacterium]|jgi:transcriptional regulator of arginine metabolism|nr:arginine repressor [Clostridiales bacterium]
MRISRQNKILEIIAENDVETQDQLQEHLRELGYNVTQATISRDIKELQLVKGLSKNGNYRYIASNYQERPISERFIKIFRETVLSYKSAQNLILVKTLSGCGNAAAEAIDCLELNHIVGTVSGDNTMLIVIEKEEYVEAVINEFDKLMRRTD